MPVGWLIANALPGNAASRRMIFILPYTRLGSYDALYNARCPHQAGREASSAKYFSLSSPNLLLIGSGAALWYSGFFDISGICPAPLLASFIAESGEAGVNATDFMSETGIKAIFCGRRS
jgi:hypothetical protein